MKDKTKNHLKELTKSERKELIELKNVTYVYKRRMQS